MLRVLIAQRVLKVLVPRVREGLGGARQHLQHLQHGTGSTPSTAPQHLLHVQHPSTDRTL